MRPSGDGSTVTEATKGVTKAHEMVGARESQNKITKGSEGRHTRRSDGPEDARLHQAQRPQLPASSAGRAMDGLRADRRDSQERAPTGQIHWRTALKNLTPPFPSWWRG